jgi:hypothetical protein
MTCECRRCKPGGQWAICTTRAEPLSQDEFLRVGMDVADAYFRHHGRPASPRDMFQAAWRILVDKVPFIDVLSEM